MADLLECVRNGLIERVREHLANGSNPNATDDTGCTALQVGVWSASMKRLMKRLCEALL